ncbi:hypothetical protein EJ06DRAFT_554515 [Trichodelitschia bisporula]|uniref:Uncharacterized protein n=1 Tax=Trichodelitschia bisporula TaxID=703511 RepID=A0A6G1I4Q8_9PEZI|nr:hypothetical protein EJ06DRAFT_554515 [Trichodelitschia bisporula]
MDAPTKQPEVFESPTTRQLSNRLGAASPENADGRRIRGRQRDISWALIALTVPMMLLSYFILFLVFHYRVNPHQFVTPNLAFNTTHKDSGVIYLDFSATIFITLASWSSTLAPLLVGFIVTLISYPVARSILHAAESGDTAELLTPYELSLVLRILASSGLGSLWQWLSYTLRWGRKREKRSKALKTMTTTLALGLLLSFLVLLTDSWLHFATETVLINLTTLRNPDTPPSYSFALTPACATLGNDCIFNHSEYTPTQDALDDTSKTTRIKTHTDDLDSETYTYLGPPQDPGLNSLDYTARSFAVKTSCTLLEDRCPRSVMKLNDGTDAWSCLDLLISLEDMYNPLYQMFFYTNSSMTQNSTVGTLDSNPFYFALLVHVFTVFMVLEPGNCSTSVYDLEYTSVDNRITRFTPTISNLSVSNMIKRSSQFQQFATVANFQAITTAMIPPYSYPIIDHTAQTFNLTALSLSFSRIFLAMAIQSFKPVPVIEYQVREPHLVARVPIAPLSAHLIANMLFVALGLVLAVKAARALHHDVGELQARLGIPALVAALFEDRAWRPVAHIEDMFDERHGIVGVRVDFGPQAEGGWGFGAAMGEGGTLLGSESELGSTRGRGEEESG